MQKIHWIEKTNKRKERQKKNKVLGYKKKTSKKNRKIKKSSLSSIGSENKLIVNEKKENDLLTQVIIICVY